MRRTISALLVLAMTFTAGWGVAAADPAAETHTPATENPPALAAHPPIPLPQPTPARSAVALLTLTTLPAGWQERMDLRPVLEVYADGRAIRKPDAVAPERDPNTPPRQVDGSVRREVVDAALAEITALSTVDLGIPASAGDGGSQIIDVMPEPPGQDLHLIVYVPDSTEGLTADQQNARKRFADVYRSLLDAFVADR
ncbi:hypothetical protein [Nocardia lijiangensis]|uniref:hypothetical protein n=1 Tax=Nocardia lijiangensis TaxID=299618 RepID=UPI0009FDEA17|nr:hypothetical protein [Nocardia lijiangensis]